MKKTQLSIWKQKHSIPAKIVNFVNEEGQCYAVYELELNGKTMQYQSGMGKKVSLDMAGDELILYEKNGVVYEYYPMIRNVLLLAILGLIGNIIFCQFFGA